MSKYNKTDTMMERMNKQLSVGRGKGGGEIQG